MSHLCFSASSLQKVIYQNILYIGIYNFFSHHHNFSGDNKRAIADYNQALRLNPNLAQAYGNRGVARDDSGDNKGAIADLHKAADLFPQQRNTQLYQKAQDLIRKYQQ
jgi:tetratricopeptide (TPR) repeat protein